MKGIVGCNAGALTPGQIVWTEDGRRLTILRKVDLAVARELAEGIGDWNFNPAPGEHFYEVDVDFAAGMGNN